MDQLLKSCTLGIVVILHPSVTPRARLGKGNFCTGESPAEPHATTVNQVCNQSDRLHVARAVTTHALHEFEQGTGGRKRLAVRLHPFVERGKVTTGNRMLWLLGAH